MAILIMGKSVCHLCGQLIGEGEDAQMFPPALFSSSEAASHLNDSSVHLRCLERLPEHSAAEVALGVYLRQLEQP